VSGTGADDIEDARLSLLRLIADNVPPELGETLKAVFAATPAEAQPIVMLSHEGTTYADAE